MSNIEVLRRICIDGLFTFAKNDADGLAIYLTDHPKTTSWLTEEEWDSLVYNINTIVFNRSACSKP